jgi:hypothetical protein
MPDAPPKDEVLDALLKLKAILDDDSLFAKDEQVPPVPAVESGKEENT